VIVPMPAIATGLLAAIGHHREPVSIAYHLREIPPASRREVALREGF